MEEVVKFSAEKEYDIGADEQHLPDRSWLLNVLAILKPDHEFFKKDYHPPIKVPPKENLVIDNADDFYTGLP